MSETLTVFLVLAFIDTSLVGVGYLLGRWHYKPDNTVNYVDDDTEDLTQVITTVGDTKHITINKTYKNKED